MPISGLQHLAFCPRQCALIHLDGVWSENFFTAAGRVMHERVHNADSDARGDVRTARGLWLRSKRLGLVGVADVVEFRRVDSPFDDAPSETQTNATERPIVAVKLPKRRGFWRPYPVEYKRGQPKKNNCDAVQLCAQAICLEESLGCAILEGALFYGTTKRRVVVRFDAELRAETTELARRFRALVDSEVVPEPVASPRCPSCSLVDECLPDVRKSASRYLRNNWREAGAFDAFDDDDVPRLFFAENADAAFDDEEDFA
ncbi:MAG: CRISPR-associated protein Cas4 [Thermoguttaceae bacterium]|nr:CRISPR-associated protein Cas4 [Thermoguttaceae bacterium]